MWQPCGIWGDFRPRCPVCWTNLRGMPDIFGVISDATRRDILQVLLERHKQDGEISVSEIVAQLELSQPTVSKHLKVLREAGLVASGAEAQRNVEQGGVRVNGDRIEDKGLQLSAGTYVVQVGKRKFARVTLK